MTTSARVLVPVALFAVSACSMLLDGQLSVIRCRDEGAYGEPACPAGETCVEGTCRAAGAPSGATCVEDTDCRAPASCLEASGLEPGAGKRCLAPCCSSDDCGAPGYGLVCVPVPLGAQNVCWPLSSLAAGVIPGSAPAGTTCADDGDCRSAACRAGRCADVCCRELDCPSLAEGCRLGEPPLGGEPSWTCGAVPKDAIGSGPCDKDDDCRSGSCSLTLEGRSYCAAACCSSLECGELTSPGPPSKTFRLACSKLNGIRACVRVVEDEATSEVGASCGADSECRSGSCIGEGAGRYCSDLCCDDASCGDLDRFACRAVSLAGSLALRCVRR
ncbi:MAG: hypothetical protein FJ095_02585 [Deltaproteobacteria bacterium]|nr:hypothetical protein [Deltaproteobacteria bacterium]